MLHALIVSIAFLTTPNPADAKTIADAEAIADAFQEQPEIAQEILGRMVGSMSEVCLIYNLIFRVAGCYCYIDPNHPKCWEPQTKSCLACQFVQYEAWLDGCTGSDLPGGQAINCGIE